MFEYSYNPTEGLLDKNFHFSFENLMRIADIANNIWDEDEDVYDLFESYDSPFWHIWNSNGVIKIEIHTNLEYFDKTWVKEHFKECVDKAVRFMLESAFTKGGK